MVLAQVTPSAAVEQLYAEFQAARQHSDFQRADVQHTQFGNDSESPLLWHDQPFSVSAEKRALHRRIGCVHINADALGLICR